MLSEYILALLKVAKEEKAEVTPKKFQKIFFLLEKEKGVNLNLDFEPYLFGPYSEKLQKAMYELADKGLIKINYEDVIDPFAGFLVGRAETYELVKDTEINISNDVLAFFREWVKKDKNEILRYVYEKYREYHDVAKIKRRLLGHD